MGILQYIKTLPEYQQAAAECDAAREAVIRAQDEYRIACDRRHKIALAAGRAYKAGQANQGN